MIDRHSMQDLQLCLADARRVIHTEWVAASRDGDMQGCHALSDLWAHVHQAHALIKTINNATDKD